VKKDTQEKKTSRKAIEDLCPLKKEKKVDNDRPHHLPQKSINK
jgi:hypothetical protein